MNAVKNRVLSLIMALLMIGSLVIPNTLVIASEPSDGQGASSGSLEVSSVYLGSTQLYEGAVHSGTDLDLNINLNNSELYNIDNYSVTVNGSSVNPFLSGNTIMADSESVLSTLVGGTNTISINVDYSETVNINTWTASFDIGYEGGVSPEDQTKDEGELFNNPGDQVRDGYDFLGWYSNGALYDFNTPANADVALVGQWSPKQFTATFNNKGIIDNAYVPVYYDGTIAAPDPAPSKEGYTFGGWFADESCSTPFDFANYVVKGDFSIFGLWTEIPTEPTSEVNPEGGQVSVSNHKFASVVIDDRNYVTAGHREEVRNYTLSYTINFTYEGTNPEIKNITVESVFKDGYNYVKKGAELNATPFMLQGDTLTIYLNGEEIGNSFPISLNADGTYTAKIVTQFGNEVSQMLLENCKVDGAVPTATVTFNGSEISTDWYNIDGELLIQLNDDTGLQPINGIYVNGSYVPVAMNENGVIPVGSSAFRNENSGGVYNVSLDAVDIVGNTTNVTAVLNIDVTAPTKGTIGLDSNNIVTINGINYIQEDTSINGEAFDSESGVKSVTVFKDGSSVSDSLPYAIAEDGAYTFEVVDNAGNICSFGLGELIGKDSDNVKIHEGTPTVTLSGLTPLYTDDVGDWFTDYPTVNYEVTGNDLNHVSVTVNDNNIVDEDISDNYSGSYNFADSGAEDILFSVTGSDVMGNFDSQTAHVLVDNTAPVVNGIDLSEEPKLNTSDSINYSGEFTITINASDNGVGVNKYFVNGSEISSNQFTISESGEYTVKVEDTLGNVSQEYKLSDFNGWNSNNVVIDSNKPVITITNPSSDTNKWYKTVGNFTVKVTDNDLLSSVIVNINGQNQLNEADLNTEEVTYLVAITDELISDTNYDYTLEVVATDNSGNVTTKTETIHIDNNIPTSVGATVSKDPSKVDNNGVYYGEEFTVTITATDDGVGIGKYYLNDAVSEDGVFTINSSGEYTVKVEDSLGNITDAVTLNSLTGWTVNNVIIDSSSPSAVIERERTADYSKDYYNDNILFTIDVSDGEALDNVKIYINDSLVTSKDYTEGDSTLSDTLTVNTDEVYSSDVYEYKVKVEVTDKTGHTTTEEDTVQIDKIAPADVTATATEVGSNFFFWMSFNKHLNVKVSATDASSGVKEYTIVNLKNNKSKSNTTGNFLIDEDGEYNVIVTDNVGNSVTISLGTLLDWDDNTVIFDNVGPVISLSRTTTPIELIENWYNGDVDFSLGVIDNKGIKSVTVTINGFKVIDYSATSVGIIELPDGYKEFNTANEAITTLPTDYKYNVKVTAKDHAGNTTTTSDVVYVDKVAPTNVAATASGVTNQKGGVTYYQGNVEATITAIDNGAGVNKFYVTHGNDVVDNTTGKFTLSSDGVYTLTVDDKVGNITQSYDLGALLSWSENNLIIDTVDPTITTARPEGESTLAPNWFISDVVYPITVTDDKGLDLVTVTINDTEVDKFTTNELNVKTATLSADTSKLASPDDYKYNVKIVAKDNSGRTKEWTDTIYIDKKAPIDVKATANGYVKEKGNTTYFTGSFDVQLSASDNGSGVNEYYLNNSHNTTGKFTISDDSNYSVHVNDKVGNDTGNIGLGTLLGWTASNVIIDGTNPVITTARPAGESTLAPSWFDRDVNYPITVTDDKGIDYVNVYVNNTLVDSFSTTELNVTEVSLNANTAKLLELGILPTTYQYNIYIEAFDNAGNTVSWSDTIYIDKKAPTSIAATTNSFVSEKGGITYYNDSITVTVTAEDDGSGVNTFIINNEENTSGIFTIASDGNYTVNVTDKVWNKSQDKTLGSLLSWSGNSIIIDGVRPTITTARPSGESDLAPDWFKNDVVYGIEVTDDKGLDNVYVYINDTLVDSFETAAVDVTSVKLNADTSKVAPTDYKYNVRIVATDNAKNVSAWADTIYIDKKAPTNVSVLANAPVKEKGGYSYYRTGFPINVSASDDGSGVNQYYLNSEVNGTGSFNLSDDGQYTVQVTDKVGNVYTNTLGSLLGWSGNNLIIDGINPVIDTYRPFGESELAPNWFSHDVNYTINMSDNKGIDYANVYINDVLVDSYSTDAIDITKVTLYADTSKIEDPADYRYIIRIELYDNAGNIATWGDTIYIDKKAPTNVQVQATDYVNQKGGNVYFNGSVYINASAEDDGSGIHLYTLNSESNADGNFVITQDNAYVLSVSDKVGNERKDLTIGGLLGWAGNNIVIDSESPVINTGRPSGESTLKANWYGEDVTYNINVTDNKGIDTVYVYINDVSVDSFTTNATNVLTVDLQASTSKVSVPADGMYQIKVVATDNAKLVTEWSDVIYIDRTNPRVVDFTISGDVYRTGRTNNGSKSIYGFFFNGNGTVEVSVEDDGASSGIKSIFYRLDSGEWIEVNTNGAKYTTISIPANFKGSIEAYTVDNTGHISAIDLPDGLVSETSNTHLNNSVINITMEDTSYADASNIPLYNKDINASALVSCEWSGIRQIEWGINSTTMGTITSFSGASKTENNLALEYTTQMPLTGNTNNMQVWVRVLDNAGHTSESNRQFGIDKDNPELTVEWDKTEADSYYNTSRIASITVEERNFDPSRVNITGQSGSLGNWVNTGDTWKNSIVFDSDGDYDFTISLTDRAGNASNSYSSGKFTIDKTNPILSVSWDNENVKNGKYYNKSRTATVTVVEKNFDSSLVNISGGTFSAWTRDGDSNKATVVFDENGIYSLSLSASDLAGNRSLSNYESGEFILDLDKPEITFTGISENTSYKNDVGFSVKISDEYLDEKLTKVTLSGKNHEKRDIEGTYDEKTKSFVFDDFPREISVDDVYTLSMFGEDLAGNTNTKEIMFSVNRYGSKFSFDDANILGNYLKEPKDIVIVETNVDKIDMDKVRIVVTKDGKEYEIDSKYISIVEEEIDGKYVYTYTISGSAFKDDGKYNVQIYSTSDDGTAYTSVAEEYSFIIDGTPPDILITGVEDNGNYNEYSRLVTLDIRDLSGISNMAVYLNGEKITPEFNESTGLYTFTVTESTETQNVQVDVVDNAGNTTTVSVKNFFISTNMWVFLFNQLWFKIILGAVGLGIIGLVGYLIKRRISTIREENRLIAEDKAFYESYSSSSSSSGGSGDNLTDSTADGTSSAITGTETGELTGEFTSEGTTDSLGEAETSALEGETSILENEGETSVLDEGETSILGEGETNILDESETSPLDENDLP